MNEDDNMSERDKQIAEHIANAVWTRIFHAATSDEVATKVIETWGGNIDRVIGRAFRRLGLYLLIALIGIGSLKLGLLDKLHDFLKP